MEQKVSKTMTSICVFIGYISFIVLLIYFYPFSVEFVTGKYNWLFNTKLYVCIGLMCLSIYNYKIWKVR